MDWIKGLAQSPPIRELERAAKAHDGDIYLVGGVLRDCVLGNRETPTDIDLAVTGSAKSFAERISKKIKGTVVVLHAETRIYRVAAKTLQVDIAEIQGDTIEIDLERRDFTVNAMAAKLPLGSEELLDPFRGMRDAKKKILRATGPRVFSEDPLRMLRAFRLSAKLDLKIETATLERIHRHRKKISKPAGERIRTELLGILGATDSAARLRAMDSCGLLTAVFPELERSRSCAEVYYGKGGVLKHSLAVVERADQLLAEPTKAYPELGERIENVLGEGLAESANPKALIRLACLLHDVAKPACAKTIKGRLRFFGHEARGAIMSVDILKRLRFSSEEIETIRLCVHHHLRPGNLAANGVVTDKAVFRFFRDLGEHGVRLLAVCWADHASYLSPNALRSILPRITENPHGADRSLPRSEEARKTLFHLQIVSYLLDQWFNRPERVRPRKILDGKEIMKSLKIPAGPAVGKALAALSEAQAEGTVKNRRDALRFLKNHKQ